MSVGTIILIIAGVIAAIWLYHKLKPYFIKHDTTILFTGGLGSGKTLNAVKKTIELWKKQVFYKYRLPNFFNRISRPFKKRFNIWKVKDRKKRKMFKQMTKNMTASQYNQYLNDMNFHYFMDTKTKKVKKHFELKKYRTKPKIYSNIPIHYKYGFFPWSKKRAWAETLTPKHLLLIKKITEYSVCLIDEFPQFINQFNYGEELVQNNANEFITFFRHYIGGYLLVTAQSESDVVVQFRRKLNQAIWCFDFKKHLFGLFYTIRMCDIMLSDNVSTMTTTQIEENTRHYFGLFPAKATYDTRCYSPRYKNIYEKANPNEKWVAIKTNKVLRIMDYTSPLDKNTSDKQKKKMSKDIEKLETKQ